MLSNLNAITNSFPHPTLPAIIGKPTYIVIAKVNLKLNRNAASVYSSLGNGNHRLLALTITPAVFNAHSAVTFVTPVSPGPNPIIIAGATAAQISATTLEHQ